MVPRAPDVLHSCPWLSWGPYTKSSALAEAGLGGPPANTRIWTSAQASWGHRHNCQASLGMQEGKGVMRGFTSGEIKDGKKPERGRKKGGMKQWWCGQAPCKPLMMGESSSSGGWRCRGFERVGERRRRKPGD